jgi:hypothetical protein
MNVKMNRNIKVGLIFTILVVVTVIASLYAASMLYHPFSPSSERRVPPPSVIPGDLEFFYIAQTIVSAINIALLVILIVNYVFIYIKTRSQFTIGLLIFASALSLKDLFANPFVTAFFGYQVFGLGPFVLIPNIFEFAALLVLLYLTIEY